MKTKTTRCVVHYTDDAPEPEPEWALDTALELESVDELEDFKFVYALAIRCLEHESLACESKTARTQVAHLLDRLTSIEWLVAE